MFVSIIYGDKANHFAILKQVLSKILFYRAFLWKAREIFYQIMHGK